MIATSNRILDQINQGEQILATLPVKGNSLLSGKLGRVLYLAYNYKLLGNEENIETAVSYLDEIFGYLREAGPEAMQELPWILPALCRVIDVLNDDQIIDMEIDAQDFLVFDETIFKSIKVFIANYNIDFLYGASGSLNYLIKRMDRNPVIKEYIAILFDLLLGKRIEDEKGIRFINAHMSKHSKSEDIDFGLAHGQCGLILTLLNIYETGLLQEPIKELVTGMLKYILPFKQLPQPESGMYSYFPMGVNESLERTDPKNLAKYNNRMGWCYGDLNIALMLYKAARILDLPELSVLANEVGLDTCKRLTTENSGIENAHLCHGSTSMVLFYDALAAENNLSEYKEARAFWFRYTQDYLDIELQKPETNGRAEQLLMGIPGAMLLLLSEELEEQTSWKSLFLL